MDSQLARQPALKITRLSSHRTCFSEDPAPGNNRRVPGFMSGVGHGGGDTRLPGVIAGVLETDAICSGGGEGWDWAGHTLSPQHFSLSGTSLGPRCPRLLVCPPLGAPLPAPPHTLQPVGRQAIVSLPTQAYLLGLPPSRTIITRSGPSDKRQVERTPMYTPDPESKGPLWMGIPGGPRNSEAFLERNQCQE